MDICLCLDCWLQIVIKHSQSLSKKNERGIGYKNVKYRYDRIKGWIVESTFKEQLV